MKKTAIAALKSSIAKGDINIVLQKMLADTSAEALAFSMDIHLIASRHESLEKDKWRRAISYEDYNVEYNKITRSILEILGSLEQSEDTDAKDDDGCLEQFIQEYENSDLIKSRASCTRSKNHASRKIGELLIKSPHLFSINQALSRKALICGFSVKVKLLPSFGDLDILSRLASPELGNFSKGSIVNALAELIYNGKLGLGEDRMIITVLETLSHQADVPLQKNIERVRAALDYLLEENQSNSNTATSMLAAEPYQYDGHIYNVLLTLNRLALSEEGLSSASFIETIEALFMRMTFCGEQDIATCRSQNWTKRVHSALMTHQVLLQLNAFFQPLARKEQQQQYQILLLNISQYIDSMIAYLFEGRIIEEAEIRHLIGKADFVSQFKKNKEINFSSIVVDQGDQSISILDMPQEERSEINKYLLQSIQAMEGLKAF